MFGLTAVREEWCALRAGRERGWCVLTAGRGKGGVLKQQREREGWCADSREREAGHGRTRQRGLAEWDCTNDVDGAAVWGIHSWAPES